MCASLLGCAHRQKDADYVPVQPALTDFYATLNHPGPFVQGPEHLTTNTIMSYDCSLLQVFSFYD